MRRDFFLAFLGLALVPASVAAQSPPTHLTVTGAIESQYIWNGFDRLNAYGLEPGPVVQPRAEIGFGASPLRFRAQGSFAVEDGNELHEAMYSVSIRRSVTPLLQLGLGYNHYDDRHTQDSAASLDAQEYYADLSAANPFGMGTRVMLQYEKPRAEGADDYFIAQAGLTYALPIASALNIGVARFDVHWHTNAVYTTGIEIGGIETVAAGFTAWQVGIAAQVGVANVAVSPHLSYQVTLDDAVNDDNPLWAGVALSVAF